MITDKRYAPPVDGYIPLAEAPQFLPVKVTKGTVWRWAQTGVSIGCRHRIILQSQMIGGRLYTKKAWIDEFVTATKAKKDEVRRQKIAELQPLPSHDEAMRQINYGYSAPRFGRSSIERSVAGSD